MDFKTFGYRRMYLDSTVAHWNNLAFDMPDGSVKLKASSVIAGNGVVLVKTDVLPWKLDQDEVLVVTQFPGISVETGLKLGMKGHQIVEPDKEIVLRFYDVGFGIKRMIKPGDSVGHLFVSKKRISDEEGDLVPLYEQRRKRLKIV